MNGTGELGSGSGDAPSMHRTRVAALLAVLMTTVAFVPSAVVLAPASNRGAPPFVLEHLIPKTFPGWRLLHQGAAQIVNPQSQQVLDKLYSQLMTRTYVSDEGYAVMLSIAYGNEQRADLAVHMPDVCYPAQGFAITHRDGAVISAGDDRVDVARLEARMGLRVEPITYWVRIGETNVTSTRMLGRRLEELRMAVQGRVPDGLLFRVSSIDPQREHAFELQRRFISDLLGSIEPASRSKLLGSR